MSAYQATRQHELVLDALGDRTRRAIIELLSERPRAVVDLAAALPVSRPAVSLHLKVLRDAGLVQDRAQGTRRVYRLDPDGLALLRTYLDRLWAGALDSFAAAAEAAHRAAQDAPAGTGAPPEQPASRRPIARTPRTREPGGDIHARTDNHPRPRRP